MKTTHKICIFSYILTSTFFIPVVSHADKINKIEIDGYKRIEKETVLSYLGLKPGDELDVYKQDQIVKNLYNSCLFENVSLKFSNGILKVDVKDLPLITDVEFKGSHRLGSNTLKKETLTKKGSSVSKSTLHADIVKIKELYKKEGKFLVDIDAQVHTLKNNRVKIIFQIKEGPNSDVKKVSFCGNKNFSEGQLKKTILTQQSVWFKFWVNNAYDPNKIEHDMYLLKKLYNAHGYNDFQIISVNPQISKNKDFFNITYVIDEGGKYSLDEITINSKLLDIDTKPLQKFIILEKGSAYNQDTLDYIAENMTHYFQQQGHPEIFVTPEITTKNTDQKLLNITFTVTKGQKVYINKINIKGNLKTRDQVIRREMGMAEGDLFNKVDVEIAERNVRNLNFFETSSVRPKTTASPDKYDLDVKIQEKPTANVGIEAGYSSAGGPFASFAMREANFLGRGQHFHLSTTKSSGSIHGAIGLDQPYFLDRNMTLGSSIFASHRGILDMNSWLGAKNLQAQTEYGVKFNLEYNLTNDLSHDIFYTYKHQNIVGSPTLKPLKQDGIFHTSAIGQSITYNKLDSVFMSKNGYMLSGSQEYAGLAGNVNFIKHEFEAKGFKSFYKNQCTLKLSVSGGIIHGINQNVLKKDTFSMGDPTFRGFAPSGMGPKLMTGSKQEGESLGGNKYYKITTEFSFPLGLPKEMNVTGNLFADFGALWDFDAPSNVSDISTPKKPNLSVGFGILWITPIAPIRIDYAFPLMTNPTDETQNIHFRFSTHF